MNNPKFVKGRSFSAGILLACALLILACVASSCSSGSEPVTVDTGDTIKSDKERNRHPDATNNEIEELVEGNNGFAFALYQAIKGEEGNIFYSPFSISQALAMTYAGAKGETEIQMGDTMRFTLPQNRLHPAFNWLDLELASRGEGAQGSDGGEFRLNIANSLWGQSGYSFVQAYLDTLAENYSAGMNLVDFIADPEACRLTINRWVEVKTEERIKELLKSGTLSTATRLVLVNAIYFNAAWMYPFPEESTIPGSFYTLDDGEITVDMMRGAEPSEMGYFDGDGFQVVDIPYDAEELAMTIILPDEGKFADVEGSLDSAMWDEITGSLAIWNVDLSMPKFEFDFPLGLKQTLSDMGMPIAFSDMADLSGINGTGGLYIEDVVHQAFIKVNEAGTEAAAATAVIINFTSMPDNVVRVDINRPFIFAIRDIPTGAVLFAGRIVNPES